MESRILLPDGNIEAKIVDKIIEEGFKLLHLRDTTGIDRKNANPCFKIKKESINKNKPIQPKKIVRKLESPIIIGIKDKNRIEQKLFETMQLSKKILPPIFRDIVSNSSVKLLVHRTRGLLDTRKDLIYLKTNFNFRKILEGMFRKLNYIAIDPIEMDSSTKLNSLLKTVKFKEVLKSFENSKKNIKIVKNYKISQMNKCILFGELNNKELEIFLDDKNSCVADSKPELVKFPDSDADDDEIICLSVNTIKESIKEFDNTHTSFDIPTKKQKISPAERPSREIFENKPISQFRESINFNEFFQFMNLRKEALPTGQDRENSNLVLRGAQTILSDKREQNDLNQQKDSIRINDAAPGKVT